MSAKHKRAKKRTTATATIRTWEYDGNVRLHEVNSHYLNRVYWIVVRYYPETGNEMILHRSKTRTAAEGHADHEASKYAERRHPKPQRGSQERRARKGR